MFVKLLCLSLITVSLLVPSTNTCHTFHNNLITATERNGGQFQINITGCLERGSFNGLTATEVHIREEKLPVLDIDAIRHMVRLKKVSISHSSLEQLKPRAFRNVPRLEKIYINFCNVTEIPSGVFNSVPSLKQLRLINNKIIGIQNGAFGDLSQLKRINVSSNELTDWRQQWFRNTTSLEVMDFQYNRIKYLPAYAFENLPRLKKIYFDHNELAILGNYAFKGLESLQYLGLSHNGLVSLNPYTVPNYLHVLSLHIEVNYLNLIHDELLKKMTVKEISLHGNPFDCNCMKNLMLWLHDTRGKVGDSECYRPDVPICSVPSSVHDFTCNEALIETTCTRKFFDALRRADPPLPIDCAGFF